MHILSEESAESNRGVRWRRQPPPAGLHSSGAGGFRLGCTHGGVISARWHGKRIAARVSVGRVAPVDDGEAQDRSRGDAARASAE